jgi:S-adenosylmethionine synthetase
MPAPISMSHALTRKLAEVRKSGQLDFIRPDGKSQVTVEYDENKNIVSVPAIVVSTQHDPEISTEDLRESVVECVIKPVIPQHLITKDTKIYVNPTGRFVIGGPVGDSGLTGRKIIVDTYGGYASHGGGAFSGKDPSKVDRSAAYMARYVAKNIVAAGMASACQIELAYAIGIAQPISVLIDTRGTGVFSDEKIAEIVKENFDFRPSKIISKLDLLRPIYRPTASYGHFGRDGESFTWEKLDMVETLKSYL